MPSLAAVMTAAHTAGAAGIAKSDSLEQPEWISAAFPCGIRKRRIPYLERPRGAMCGCDLPELPTCSSDPYAACSAGAFPNEGKRRRLVKPWRTLRCQPMARWRKPSKRFRQRGRLVPKLNDLAMQEALCGRAHHLRPCARCSKVASTSHVMILRPLRCCFP